MRLPILLVLAIRSAILPRIMDLSSGVSLCLSGATPFEIHALKFLGIINGLRLSERLGKS